MPLGPNGVPTSTGFNIPSPLSNLEGVISYDYTLDQQGLKSNVTCSYAQTNPFSFAPLYNSNFTTSYNVNCTDQGKTNALTNVAAIRSTWTDNMLVYWACQDGISTPSYTIHLAGLGNYYSNQVGNITCVINPIQSALYSVTYRSTEDIFSATEASASSPITLSPLINNALLQFAELMSVAQNYGDNILVEMIINLGFKSFAVPADPDLPPPQYLILYEHMIQGIIEYEVRPVNYFIAFLSLIVVSPPR